MESFGTYLRRERELRGVSLEHVVEATRIPRGNIEALERDDQAHLPERVYVLGWVRSYARAVGLEPEDAALRYEEFLLSAAPPEPRLASDPAGAPADSRRWVLAAGVFAIAFYALLRLFLLP